MSHLQCRIRRPDNDVEKFPNDITMISFLSVAPSDNETTRPTSRPMSPEMRNDDIKQCLSDRVQRLRDKIAEAQVAYIKKMSSWEAEVDEAKKIIRIQCAQFKQAIERREEALVTKLDEFSAKRQASCEAANADFNHQMLEMTNFCDQVEKQLKGTSERKATQNLDRCLEMLETLEASNESNHGSTNGSKWVAKFQPDRKDTVHASIAMFGQLTLQEPGSTQSVKKKLARQKYTAKTSKRVYTRDFLLKIQPLFFASKPKELVNFPEITPVVVSVCTNFCIFLIAHTLKDTNDHEVCIGLILHKPS